MSPYGNWSYPTTIKFGAERILEIADACKQAGIRKPLLVTDRGLAGLPMTAETLGLMDSHNMGCAMFSEVDPNPTEKNVQAGVRAFELGGHDGVIAFGGGSALDCGKMIAFMIGQNRPIWDFEDVDDWWTRADAAAIRPIVAVPTTAGTGSEVGRASVITNSETHVKKIIFHPKVLPTVVICDPELTVFMPKIITIGTGMDAFAHCLEAYCSPHYHPMSQGIALEGLRLVKENLPLVVDDPTNLEARAHMMSAAMMGATAFQKGLGAVHALSHPIGAVFNTHHGMTNAVVIPPVLRLNRPAIEDPINKAADYLGIRGGFDGFYDFVMQLRSDLSVPDTLADMGVNPDNIDTLVEMALQDPSCAGNPVELNTENMRQLFLVSIQGQSS